MKIHNAWFKLNISSGKSTPLLFYFKLRSRQERIYWRAFNKLLYNALKKESDKLKD